MKIIQNKLHEATWYEKATESVRDKVASVGESNVWLTGHSLGAAMAMLAGKYMAKAGKYLEAFLFNPPFISVPIGRIVNDKNVEHGIRFAGNVIRFALAAASAVNGNGSEDNWFGVMSGWIPRLFVNKVDIFCSEYINYFEHRKKMDEIGSGAAAITNIASRFSLRDQVKAARKGVKPKEPLHLLPSANLIVNLNPGPGVVRAHSLNQWWRPDLKLECSVYQPRV